MFACVAPARAIEHVVHPYIPLEMRRIPVRHPQAIASKDSQLPSILLSLSVSHLGTYRHLLIVIDSPLLQLSPSPSLARRKHPSMAAKSVDTAAGNQQQETESMADVYNTELTPLQQHAAFFDRNKDGIIYPSETYEGLRAIGCGVALSTFGAGFINSMLGPSTVPENMKAPALKFPIYLKNIQKGKHGSDTDTYDAQGRFVPEKFEEIFKKHAHTRPDALTGKELQELLQANRERNDLKGRTAAFVEWKLIYSLCKDKEGFLHKETVKAIYDGSIFVKLEQEKKEAKESGKKK